MDHRGLRVEVTRKDISTLRVRVLPPDGAVKVSVPRHVPRQAVVAFLDGQLEWIVSAQERIRSCYPAPMTLAEAGQVPVWGEQIAIDVRDAARVSTSWDEAAGALIVAGPDEAGRRRGLESFYRRQIANFAPPLVERWQSEVGRAASQVKYRRMTTRWGTCNVRSAAITLNIALAERRPELLEYVVIHEVVHLAVADHGPRFQAWMDRLAPDWRALKRELNATGPVR